MITVLFACVHNAGRSQIAETLFNKYADSSVARAISAGTDPAAAVHREVIDAMRARGFDLSDRTPRKLTSQLAAEAQWLITMGCGDQCPFVPGARVEDWPLTDPKGQTAEVVEGIVDDIDQRVQSLLTRLSFTPSSHRGDRIRVP